VKVEKRGGLHPAVDRSAATYHGVGYPGVLVYATPGIGTALSLESAPN
jgi:hypothetical protein